MPLRTPCATHAYESQDGKWQGICCGMQHVGQPIYLKKGMRIACVESALPVPSAELSLEVQAALGDETWPEPLLVVT